MKKKAMWKDFYMEIRKSPGRFLSILFIVALGVAFFSGIRASEPDMRITGDAYFDSENLMDIKALSTYGVTEDDVEAFQNLEGVELAEGAYSADFLHNTEDDQRVLHVMGSQKEMNQITVSEGRMPETVGECLVDDASDYQVGDEIVLTSGTEDPVSDTLKTDTLEVVGRGNSSAYVSFGRGSAAIGTGNIYAFVVVPEDTFVLDTFTEVYLKVEGAKELTEFTDAYDDKIAEVQTRVEDAAEGRGVIRKDEIVQDAEEVIADAEKELEDGRKEARKELKEAKKEIEDGEKELEEAKKQIEDGKQQIADAKDTLNEQQKTLDQSRKEYKDGKKALKKGQKQYNKAKKEFDKNRPDAEKQIEAGKSQLKSLEEQLQEDEKNYQKLQEQIDNLEKMLQSGTGTGNGDAGQGSDAGNRTSSGASSSVQNQLEQLKTQADGLNQKIAAEKSAYSTAQKQLSDAENQLSEGEEQLAATEKTLNQQEKKLAEAKKQLEDGQKQIDDAWKELEEKEQELADGEEEIRKNEEKLADARKEYRQGRKDAKQEIADGEKEIEEARQDLADLEDPKWYVYDRTTLIEHSSFGENAERLGAIGKVFPVLFFLVAALISLTSMTRMVEEQRTSIGTMKALGYGQLAIASKYLGYAFLATVGGSVIGVLFGEKVFPYIIIYAYSILYPNLKQILVPYDWGYGLMASGIAIFCTMFATFFACWRELNAQPSVLMRPPAPKNGRRVLLERVRIVWNHLNFTWKSTIRNLMRYKKRFFMTIFGIGGCMALMLVGFGLKDSCYEIAELQYEEIQFYDASVYLDEDITDEERDRLHQILSEESYVECYMDVEMQSLTLVSEGTEREVYECVFPASEEEVSHFVDFHDRKTKEQYTLSDNGVIISEKTAKLLNVQEGDDVYIKDEEEGNKPVHIEHICENYLGHYMYMTPAYYETVYGEEPEYNTILFIQRDDEAASTDQTASTDSSASSALAASSASSASAASSAEPASSASSASSDPADMSPEERLQAVGESLLKEDGVLNVSYMSDMEQQLDDMLRSLNLVIIVLIISAGMLAFVVLYNLNTVNIAERKRELATLKVLGFYDMEVAEYVYRENILLTFIGAALGCILGKFLHLFIIQTVEVDSAMFGRIIHGTSYLYSLLFTVLFSLIINGLMYFKLKKIDMVESLKSVE